jgi:crotonobetainyl-CoA:carnitine CoA-transferase CaiB-like acyl-CoA transferase
VGPLSGVKIVEAVSERCPLPLRLSVALCARIAANLGAEVVRLRSLGGDPIELIGPRVGSQAALTAFLHPGRARTETVTDVVTATSTHIANGYACLLDSALHRAVSTVAVPALAVVFSLLASVGPEPEASEFTLMALGGLLDMVGDAARQPLRLGGHQLAYSAALAGYAGLAAALCRPEPSDTVDVSLLDVAVWLNWKTVAIAAMGREPPSRTGRDGDWQTVRCQDGWIALVYQESDWPSLKALVGDDRLEQPQYATLAARRRNRHTLVAIVQQAFASRPRAEIYASARRQRIPLGPVWTPDELLRDAQNTGRGFFESVLLDGRTVSVPRLPVLWNSRGFAVGAASR